MAEPQQAASVQPPVPVMNPLHLTRGRPIATAVLQMAFAALAATTGPVSPVAKWIVNAGFVLTLGTPAATTVMSMVSLGATALSTLHVFGPVQLESLGKWREAVS